MNYQQIVFVPFFLYILVSGTNQTWVGGEYFLGGGQLDQYLKIIMTLF